MSEVKFNYRGYSITVVIECHNNLLYGCYLIRYGHKILRADRKIAEAGIIDQNDLVEKTRIKAQYYVEKAIEGENIA